MKGKVFFAFIVPLVTLLVSAPAHAQTQNWTVSRAWEWDYLFSRALGWTGADGIYSIPLSGVDAPGTAAQTDTAFVFSDTFIGRVGLYGRRLSGTTLVNNTAALLRGGSPTAGNITFAWGKDSEGNPQALFIPNTPNSNIGDWYWPSDGISLNNNVYLFASRMTEGGGGAFNFAVAGISLLTFPLDSPNPISGCTQVDTPLFHVPSDGRGEIIFGNGITANTEEAGAPEPDGYIYIYGHQNDASNKKLIAARVLPENFNDFSLWRFWDGATWSADIDAVAPLTSRISSEFSVSPLPDGRYILVFQLDTLSQEVAVRIGASPVGPFGNYIKIWHCPEPDLDPDIYVYNAKAHPHLSQPGELLISYNVNSFSLIDHFENADIYRPRFIRIRVR